MKEKIKIAPFGNFPVQGHNEVIFPAWKKETPGFADTAYKWLAVGNLNSYGDSCLNKDNNLISTKYLSHLISFDKENGIIECESGVLFSDIIDLILPQGWFLPVTPGTKYISVGGAVANDVHGKNHIRSGTFGRHVISFDLLRSDGDVYRCSEYENTGLFRATIGGLGLTGLILSVRFGLQKVVNCYIENESLKIKNLEHFFEINKQSENNYQFTVAWVDCLAKGKNLGKGIYYRGNDSQDDSLELKKYKPAKPLTFPFKGGFINPITVSIFNKLYYMKQLKSVSKGKAYFEPFYYPLDGITKWNNAYGKKGFLQYQFVVPFGDEKKAVTEILKTIADSGMSSFLTVLKTFGELASPGMLSFPMPGVTFAIDFRNSGSGVFKLLDRLDDMVSYYGGRIYPAKDARVSSEKFKSFYPAWEEFSRHMDPKFSSSYWRRVIGE